MSRILLILAIMLSGCSSIPQHLTEERQNEIRNVAVISLVPESVNFDKIGTISFFNQHTVFDMNGKVASAILSAARARIVKSHPGWAVKSVRYDQAALLAIAESPLGFSATAAKDTFADLARKNKLDAIFVVRAAEDTDNNLREGINVLFANNPMDASQRLTVRANLNVAITDKQGEIIAEGGVPASLDNVKALDPDAFGLKDKMESNLRPEVFNKLAVEVVADLTRRLNLCFDSLGF